MASWIREVYANPFITPPPLRLGAIRDYPPGFLAAFMLPELGTHVHEVPRGPCRRQEKRGW